MLDPVIDHMVANSKMFRHLMDCQLIRLFERGRWNPVAEADPLDYRCRVRLYCDAALALLMELRSDLCILQVVSHVSDAVDDRGGIPQAVRYIGRKRKDEVRTGIPLPADVDQKLLGSRLFNGNVLDEQPQHPLAVFSLCRWSVP